MTKITLNQNYLSYQIDESSFSGFTLFDAEFTEKIIALIPKDQQKEFREGKPVHIQDSIFREIREVWHRRMYKPFKDIWVPRYADDSIVPYVYEAYENGIPLMVRYKKGYESYPFDEENACVSDDGLTHVLYVGKSTGQKPVLLHLESKCASGGSEFFFAGITEVKSLAGTLCAA